MESKAFAAEISPIRETNVEEVHSMKLSIEFPSIKNLPYAVNVGISYTLPLFGSKSFTTSNPTAVAKGADASLRGTFASYPFEATKSELYSLLSTTELLIEVNNYSKDPQNPTLLGTSRVPLKELIGSNAVLEKTAKATVRAYDSELPIINTENNSIGTLRFLAYLEDFGAILEPQNQSSDTNKENVAGAANAKKTKEYEALWQLEMWKKAEEAKFNAYLKEKAALHLAEVLKEYKAREEKREQEFLEASENVKKLQQAMTKKARDLQKREQKLATLEDELRRKIGEVTKQLASKEEEIVTVKTRCKEENAKLEREKASLINQLAKYKDQLSEITDKYYLLNKELQESSMNALKQEISAKGLEVIELEKKLEKSAQAKELYKAQYEKIKEEIIRMREAVQNAKEQELKQQAEEIERLKYQISMPRRPPPEEPMIKSAKLPIETARMSMKKEEPTARQSNVFLHTYEYPAETVVEAKGELERLLNEKQELLESGLYNEGDEIIRTLNSQIAEVMKNQ